MPTTKRKLIIAVAAYAAFLATFNETLLNVAFSLIMTEFSLPISTVQWLSTAYMLVVAVMIPVSSFAYSNIPTRRLFAITLGILVGGCVIGATSTSFAQLLIGRIVQAIGSGMLIPIGMDITLAVALPERRGACMGLMAAMTTIGVSASVIVSGMLLSVAEWRMLIVFFGVLCALCLVMGVAVLTDVADLTHPRLDMPSVPLVTLALVGILYGISTAFAGSLPVALGSLAVGVFFLVLFVRRQAKLDEPLVDFAVMRYADFSVGVGLNVLALLAVLSSTIIIPTYLQSVLGTSSMEASLTLFPAIALCCFVSPLAGRIYDKRGIRRLLPIGFILIGVFSLLLAMFARTEMLVLRTLLFAPMACGAMLVIGPVQSHALSKLPDWLKGHGVTVMTVGFQIAGCIGASVFTGVYSVVANMAAASGAVSADAYTLGFAASTLLVAVCALTGLGLSMWLVSRASRSEAAAAPSLQVTQSQLQ